MKKKQWTLCLMVVLMAMSLMACKSKDNQETTVSFETNVEETTPAETKPVVPETIAPEHTEAETEAPKQETTTKNPPVVMTSGDKRLTEDELKKYAQYFSEYGTWYTQALTSFYDSAKQVDLAELFYGGIDFNGQDELTDAEKTYLKENATAYYEEGMDTSRLPVEDMDQILQQYFGLSYEKTAKVGTDRMSYWKETDSFYITRGDTNATKMVPYAGVQRPNGNVVLFYEHDLGGYAMITVKPVDGGLRIVANQKVSTGK